MSELPKETELRWIKHGSRALTSLMGKDVVMLTSGRFITFTETSRPEKKEILYDASSEVRGDGIQCICSHGILPCFAFAERSRNPRILIMCYPTIEVIKCFESVTDTNFVALRFSEMEFLVALTGVPDCKIIIWNWRTAEKLCSQITGVQSPTQILRVSPTSPVQIIQTTGEDHRLTFWDMNLCYKKTLLNMTSIVLPQSSTPPYCFTYGADGDVYFVDSQGSLYSINSETHVCSKQYTCNATPNPDFIPCMTWYKGGVVFATPSEVLFLRRKSPEGWAKIWSYVPKVPFKGLMASNVKDLLVGVSTWNDIMVFKGETQVECTFIKNFGSNFDFVCFVYPVGDFFTTFGNQTKTFIVWSKANGEKMSHMNWTKDRINDLQSNSSKPYMVAVTAVGSVHVISTYDCRQLLEVDNISLTSNSLDAIRFRPPGNQFCVANMEVGEFFLLKIPAKLEVIAYVKIDLKIVDYCVLEREVNSNLLLVVPMSQFCCRSGQTVLLFSLDEKNKAFVQTRDVHMPSVVTQITHSPVNPREIICIPHRSRKFIIVNILSGKMINEFVSGHQMKFFSILPNGQYLFTFGTDGLVIVNLSETNKCITLFSSHHRMARGIKAIIVGPYAGYVITLGHIGSLICTYLRKIENTDTRAEFEALMATAPYKQLHMQALARARALEKSGQEEGAAPSKEPKTNWLVTRQQEIVNLEEQQARRERQSVLEEFQAIKKKVCQLLDENQSNPMEKQILVYGFDLDKPTRRKKLEDAKAEREREKQFTLARIKYLGKLAEVIKSNCWESIAVKGKELQGICAPLCVQSYALFADSEAASRKAAWLEETKKAVEFFRTGDFFEPWVPRTDSQLEQHINAKSQMSTLDVVQTIKIKYEEEQIEDEKTETEEEVEDFKDVWSGTSTHNFVEVDPKHYSQFELTTFLQSHQEMQFIENDIKKLMLWFNKEFSETFALKEREMEFVNDRNNRLRHIIKELTFFNFSPNLCMTQIYDPEWAPEENPETIMKVEDKEVTCPKYISDSEMYLIKKKEAEEERLRQLMLADDFKERALIVMMDGVLEKLWEDEIKKDVPKPKCMVEKEPSAWTEDDLKLIRAYEESVKFLLSERERYRKILEGRWASTVATMKDSVAKFDEKVAKLHLLKLKVESAIGQETLKALRIRKKCFDAIELQRKREAIKQMLSKNEKRIESMMLELNKLQEVLNECRNVYESLQNKDKNLDKNFKREFPDYSPIICEQLYKQSKKRPKLLQKAAMYSTVLVDLGKCTISGTKPDYLPGDCIVYLKDVDALDAYSNAPASVSQQAWELTCKLRRLKIDTELRIRACAIDLADAEATVANYHKALKAAREHQTQLQSDLQAAWAEKHGSSLNFQVQLVLKRGLVEIPLTGQISDFDESVLVTKDTLKEVNKAIHKIGKQKIKAMQKAANFRKGIIYNEWEHKKLRMEIEDLKGQLETIEKLQVFKELQAILVARARGFSDEKGFLYLENELAKVKEKFQKAQVEIYGKMDDLDMKIQKLNSQNHELDLKIIELNVEVNELNLSRDMDFDKKHMEENMKRMKKVRERSKLVRKIQDQHNEILVLQTELELLRLKTYPTIKYKMP